MNPHDDQGVNLNGGTTPSYLAVLGAVIEKFRKYHRLLAALIVAFVAIGFISIVLLPPRYTAVAVIGPTESPLDMLTPTGSGGLGASLAQGLGRGLFGTAGATNDFDKFQEILTSDRMAAFLASDPNILRALFYKKYDWKNHTWHIPSNAFAMFKNDVKRLIHYPIKTKPDADDVAKYLRREVTVDAPLTSVFVTVSLEAESPQKGEWLLGALLRTADSMMRHDRREDIAARVRYLAQVLPTITQADQREILSTILSQQQQSLMMVEADKYYGAALIGSPYASRKPSSPSILKVLGTMLFLAAAVWIGLVFLFSDTSLLLSLFITPLDNRRNKLDVPENHRADANSRFKAM